MGVAYAAGLISGLCGSPEAARRLKEAGVAVGEDAERMAEEACRFRPSSPEEAEAFLRGLFEAHGEFFDPDPHGDGEVIIVFKGAADAAAALELLGIGYLATSDELGLSRYVVVYERGEVAKFLKRVRPKLPEVPPLRRKLESLL